MNFKEIQSNKDVDRFHIVLRKKRPVQEGLVWIWDPRHYNVLLTYALQNLEHSAGTCGITEA